MNLTQYTVYLEIQISIDEHSMIKALVNSEAIKNYIITVYA